MSSRAIAALTLLLATAVAGWFAVDLRIDNRLERWFGENSGDAEAYAEFRRDFGSDEFLFAVVGGGEFFTSETLETMLVASERIEAIAGVIEVQGIPTLYRDRFGAEDPEALAFEMTSTPFYRDLFLSSDETLAGILVRVSPDDDPASRRRIVSGVRAALSPIAASGRDLRLVGSTALIVALDEVSEAQARRTLPWALAGSLFVLALMLRSLRAMMVAAFCACVTVVLTLGAAAAYGLELNMVTTMLPPLLWVLAISNSVHILRRFQQHHREHPRRPALGRALRETTRPCTLAAITTAVGFASLSIARMEPVREFGTLAAVGILLSLAVNLTLAPVLIGWLRVPAFRGGSRLHGKEWSWGWKARPRMVLAAFGVLLVFSLLAIPFIRAQADPVAFLPTDHPTTRAYRSLDGGPGGFYTVEVRLQVPDLWYDPEVWPTIDALAQRIESSPIVSRVLSPIDVVRKLNQWSHDVDPADYRMPASHAAVAAAIEAGGPEGRRRLRNLVLPDDRTVRLSALVNEIEEHQFLELVAETRRFLETLPPSWSAAITGQVLLLVSAQQTLVATQIKSLGLASLLVFAVIALGLKSWRLTVAAILPNLIRCSECSP